jgi:hypothetical protein
MRSTRTGRPAVSVAPTVSVARGVLVVGAALAAVVGLAACGGPDITQARMDDAVGPAFAQLWANQQRLLGKPVAGVPEASASCARSDKAVASQGAGDDWVCRLLLQRSGAVSIYTYELNVQADGCYTADGPPAVVGGRTLTTPAGGDRVNPLFEFDGCFDTT